MTDERKPIDGDAILAAVDELHLRVLAGTATPAEIELDQAVDDADRDLGVGRWYRAEDWCPDCHTQLVKHGPNGEHFGEEPGHRDPL